MIVIALFIYILKLFAGFFLTHLIWDAKEPKALTFKFFLGAGMGAGISSLLYFLWSWLTLPGKIYPFFELFLFLMLIFAVWRKTSKVNLQEIRSSFSVPSKWTFFWVGLLTIAGLICTANFFFFSRMLPHGIYDAWDIWNVAARFMYFAPNDWIQAISQNAWDHADYPLLLPLNVADAWAIIGINTTQAPIAFSLLFMLCLPGLLFSILWISKDISQGAFVAIIFISLSELLDIGVFQYADIQLTYFFLATAALFYLYTLQPNLRFIFLAGLFAGFSAWTKNEGSAFVFISLLLCLVLSFKEKKNLFLSFVLGLLFPLIVIALFKSIAPQNDLFVDKASSLQQLLDISRYQIIFAKIWREIMIFGAWPVNFFMVLALYALFVWKSAKAKGQHWIPFSLFLLQFAGYFVIYLLTPHDLSWHLNTSLDRLAFHVSPLFLFWLFNLLPSPVNIFAPKTKYRESNVTSH